MGEALGTVLMSRNIAITSILLLELISRCPISTPVGETPRYIAGKKPLDYLEYAAKCYATAVKCSSKDEQAHVGLGLVMEEFFYAEDLYGLQREV